MKHFIITHPEDPLQDLETQRQLLTDEVYTRLLLPHQAQLQVYDEEMVRLYKKIETETDPDAIDKKEQRYNALKKSEAEYRLAHANEERVIRELVTQIIHIVATEIMQRKPSQVLCDYRNTLFTIPLRYKN